MSTWGDSQPFQRLWIACTEARVKVLDLAEIGPESRQQVRYVAESSHARWSTLSRLFARPPIPALTQRLCNLWHSTASQGCADTSAKTLVVGRFGMYKAVWQDEVYISAIMFRVNVLVRRRLIGDPYQLQPQVKECRQCHQCWGSELAD